MNLLHAVSLWISPEDTFHIMKYDRNTVVEIEYNIPSLIDGICWEALIV